MTATAAAAKPPTTTPARKTGRKARKKNVPSKAMISQWRQVLHPLWMAGLGGHASHQLAAEQCKKRGIPAPTVKTVYQVYEDWAKEYAEAHSAELAERQDASRTRALLAVDTQMAELRKVQASLERDVERELTLRGEEDRMSMAEATLRSERRQVATELASMAAMRHEIEITPLITDKLDAEVEAYVAEQAAGARSV